MEQNTFSRIIVRIFIFFTELSSKDRIWHVNYRPRYFCWKRLFIVFQNVLYPKTHSYERLCLTIIWVQKLNVEIILTWIRSLFCFLTVASKNLVFSKVLKNTTRKTILCRAVQQKRLPSLLKKFYTNTEKDLFICIHKTSR